MEVFTCTKLFSNQVFNVLSIFLLISLAQCASPSKVQETYTNFITKSCNNTMYPALCVQTLTPYAPSVGTRPLKLCNAALKAAILSARHASATVSKIAKRNRIARYEAKAIKDCIGDMKDTVYELKLTLNAMGHLNEPDKDFQWANAKTWASAAITDADSCIDGFSGRKVNPVVKKKIGSRITEVQKRISIALSLINHLY
ncbi:Plant invertase/pectin methylesterase inhibitor superfamily protein [Forsythia ovata]|uniref:Plant invertase/pectin methylesterase inhibitor superfamily protein n=1 Tax=Forsythia ovata TaxID=205694 RepID=A0ABD1WKI1_9LAMI